jgi:disulfide bond formation protein DsbB
MDIVAAQLFSGLLTVLTAVGVVVTVTSKVLSGRLDAARQLHEMIASVGLWLAFAVSAGATAGSLYFSEVANYLPCQLCWFQRIAMYPLAVITLVAALRRDRNVVWYVVPIASIGAGIAAWHYLIEWRPSLDGGGCSAVGPSCVDVWFREFGFISLASMALVGFIAVIVFTVSAAASAAASADHADDDAVTSA